MCFSSLCSCQKLYSLMIQKQEGANLYKKTVRSYDLFGLRIKNIAVFNSFNHSKNEEITFLGVGYKFEYPIYFPLVLGTWVSVYVLIYYNRLVRLVITITILVDT